MSPIEIWPQACSTSKTLESSSTTVTGAFPGHFLGAPRATYETCFPEHRSRSGSMAHFFVQLNGG
ncbi:hypothetical protein PsorP6_006088 [Peronosclerospora sorghi]|uniref:Uncharacterized protein n=1 Tax=Peronosclerospora sorghi TaxID=230839 RepID=A0ACC0W0U3_9STRA|nr:hypothetical protein PsorP6_006088 [Peronosclerospora sorghi]